MLTDEEKSYKIHKYRQYELGDLVYKNGIFKPPSIKEAKYITTYLDIRKMKYAIASLYFYGYDETGSVTTYYIELKPTFETSKQSFKYIPSSGSLMMLLERINPKVRMSHKDDILCISDHVPDGYVEEPKMIMINDKIIPYDLYKYGNR